MAVAGNIGALRPVFRPLNYCFFSGSMATAVRDSGRLARYHSDQERKTFLISTWASSSNSHNMRDAAKTTTAAPSTGTEGCTNTD